MVENSVNKEALAAGKHKEIKRHQSIKKQATIKKSAQIFNVSQQQRASTLLVLATPSCNTIIKDQTNNISQGNNEEKKKYNMILQQTSPVNHKDKRLHLAKL